MWEVIVDDEPEPPGDMLALSTYTRASTREHSPAALTAAARRRGRAVTPLPLPPRV